MKHVMCSIGNNKSPGPNGFASYFLKNSWDSGGQDVCKDFFIHGKLLGQVNATTLAMVPKEMSFIEPQFTLNNKQRPTQVLSKLDGILVNGAMISKYYDAFHKDFFIHDKLLGQVNATTLAMVPKVFNPMKPSDLRLIACFDSIYKCITKVLSERMELVL
ncbi:LOW QUALITY PROTEIN: hypothetical protein Cgig2_014539 [Carnegiea gigantea]|uniref:Uncharacterized protein n=1 Tax=Carnegiea gigantea TaxID=171969 RepID=A0A9Q1K0N9_9CARY|nr:LOW QUALITY PROTEIN: hypothetical protein Cgig2_014539 [Carnegiea gigantea]